MKLTHFFTHALSIAFTFAHALLSLPDLAFAGVSRIFDVVTDLIDQIAQPAMAFDGPTNRTTRHVEYLNEPIHRRAMPKSNLLGDPDDEDDEGDDADEVRRW